AESFVCDPFGPPGGRLYRTGDRVRLRADGNLEFLGRRDEQVKIRGFRVELGEVEATLASHPAVRQAAAMVREDRPGAQQLVAYVVAEGVNRASLRGHLQRVLPEYMVPSAFVLLPALPLTPNGKVDRTALHAPDGECDEGEQTAPRTPLEELLAGIWADVL